MISRGLGLTVVGAVVGALVGLGLGWASRWVFVVALAPIIVGIVVAAATATVALTLRHPRRRALAQVAVVVGALGGWMGFATAEDQHFVDVFGEEFSAARMADDGVPPEMMNDDALLDLFREGADADLERQVVDDVGFGGVAGRWLFRSELGIRLVGPWDKSRGLSVGRGGAIAWAVIELLLSIGVGWLVIARIWAAATRGADAQKVDAEAVQTDP